MKPKAPAAHVWVEEFLGWLRDSRGLSEDTILTYRKGVGNFQAVMDVDDFSAVTTRDLDKYMGRLHARGLSPNTRRGRMAAVRSLFGFLKSRGLIAVDPALEARAPEQKLINVIPVFTTDEIQKLIFARSEILPRQRREPRVNFERRARIHDLKELRDTALLGLSYALGLRASEPGNLLRSDFIRDERGRPVLFIRSAKWSREPTAHQVDVVMSLAVEEYLSLLDKSRDRSVALFPPLLGRAEAGISGRTVEDILRRRVLAAGIPLRGRRLTPHVLRYSVATHLYQGGMRLLEIQAFMRHRSLETTQRYIRLGSVTSVQRMAMLHLPWGARHLRDAARCGGLPSLDDRR